MQCETFALQFSDANSSAVRSCHALHKVKSAEKHHKQINKNTMEQKKQTAGKVYYNTPETIVLELNTSESILQSSSAFGYLNENTSEEALWR